MVKMKDKDICEVANKIVKLIEESKDEMFPADVLKAINQTPELMELFLSGCWFGAYTTINTMDLLISHSGQETISKGSSTTKSNLHTGDDKVPALPKKSRNKK